MRPCRRDARLTLVLLLTITGLLPTFAAMTNLVVNTGLTLEEGTSAIITSAQLRVVKTGVPDAEMTYRLVTAPTFGTLLLNNLPIGAEQTFTQAQINAGLLRYSHAGGEELSDSFDIAAFNGAVQGLERVSINLNGTQITGSASSNGIISANGSAVLYTVTPNQGPLAGHSQAFLYDQALSQTTQVSVRTGGTVGSGGVSGSRGSDISADGTFIAFYSDDTNLVAGDTNGVHDVFRHNRNTGQTARVSLDSSHSQTTGGLTGSVGGSLSANGNVTAFVSDATSLVNGDTNEVMDVFVHNWNALLTLRISVATGGAQANGVSDRESISDDGNVVAFISSATNLVSSDTNGVADIFVRHISTGQTSRVSVDSFGIEANGSTSEGSIAADGRSLVFVSTATNLVSNDTNNAADVFVHDRISGQTTRVSVDSFGVPGDKSSSTASISSNGRYVTFASNATNLISNDTNSAEDVFVHDRMTGQTTRISVPASGTQISGSTQGFSLSDDGRYVAFSSTSANFISGDTNNTRDVFVADTGLRQSFNLTITPINDAPSISLIADQRTPENTATQQIIFSLTDPETILNCADVQVTSSNPLVVPNDPQNLLVGARPTQEPHEPICTLTIVPTAEQLGTTTITVGISDSSITDTTSFVLTVEPITPPPWLVLLYLAGNDQPGGVASPFEADLRLLLSRLATMPANPSMRLVVLFDGNQANDSALLVRDPGTTGLRTLSNNTPPSWFVPELDMGSPSTLSSFIGWAQERYAGSPRQMLSIVDHGGGWAPDRGDGGQPRGSAMSRAAGVSGLALDASANNDEGTTLSTRQLREALTGHGHFDLLFLDACLMGTLEVAYEIHDFTNYLIVGQSLLFAELPYQSYLANAMLTGNTTGRELAEGIVASYNPLVPDQTRPFTIAALDTSKLSPVVTATQALAEQLLEALPASNELDLLTRLRASPTVIELQAIFEATQHFDGDADYQIEPTDAYVDLTHLATQLGARLPNNSDRITPGVTSAANSLLNAIGLQGSGLIIAQRSVSGVYQENGATWDFTNARGISIYMPIGTQDCRPSGQRNVNAIGAQACRSPGSPAQVDDIGYERQLYYYSRADQLYFTRDAGTWAQLLVLLEPIIPAPEAVYSAYPLSIATSNYLPIIQVSP